MRLAALLPLPFLFLAPTAWGQDLEKKSLTISSESFQVGESFQVTRSSERTRSWKGQGALAGESDSVSRGGKTVRFQVTVAAIDTSSRASRLLVRRVNDQDDLVEETFARDDPPQGRDSLCWTFAQEFFRPPARSFTHLFGFEGKLDPDQEVELPPALWKELVWGETTEKVARFLGRDPKTGHGVIQLRLVLSERNTPTKGATTRSVWTGKLTFDPRGPRLVSVVLDSKAKIDLPPAKPGEVKATGSVRQHREIKRPAR